MAALFLAMAFALPVRGADGPATAAGERTAVAPKAGESPAGEGQGEAEARAVVAAYANEVVKYVRTTLLSGLYPALRPDPDMLRKHYQAEFTQQFRPLLLTEMRFIQRICRPGQEEQGAIRAAGDQSLQLAVNAYVDALMGREAAPTRAERPKEWPNPRKLILDELARAVEKTLPGDRGGRYRAELEKRAAARKRATVVYVISKFDRSLLLSEDQRDRLAKIIDANWKEEWGDRLEHLRHGEELLPVLPEDQVLPLLSEPQKEIWNRRSKVENRILYWGGFGFFQPAPEDAVEAEPAAEEPKAKEEAPAKKPAEKQ